jgi:hypothetical protein
VPDGGGGGELRPVPLHGGVEVQLAPVGVDQCAYGREGLGDRVRLDQGVALPGRASGVRLTSPEVDDPGAVGPGGDRRARAALRGQHIGQRLAHRLETAAGLSVD